MARSPCRSLCSAQAGVAQGQGAFRRPEARAKWPWAIEWRRRSVPPMREAKPVSAMDSESRERFTASYSRSPPTKSSPRPPRLGGGAVAELVERLDGLDEAY